MFQDSEGVAGMVSLAQTSKKYHGKKAKTYDTVRTKQARWTFENDIVEEWLRELKPAKVLDCPVGTGRFIKYYADNNVKLLTGIDISADMLAQARKKVPRKMKTYCDVKLHKGDITNIDAHDQFYDCTVCVRFLDLIDDAAMYNTMVELCRVTSKNIICTIRFGEEYVPKSNTAEHDIRGFMPFVERQGFKVSKFKQFREGSWHILLLERV
jgi:ubiquinone/menaquinone biosynthesis C-methylase UbiE